jgi:hypothetical protein
MYSELLHNFIQTNNKIKHFLCDTVYTFQIIKTKSINICKNIFKKVCTNLVLGVIKNHVEIGRKKVGSNSLAI